MFHTPTYTHTYTNTCTYARTYIYIYTYICLFTYLYMCIYTCICIYISSYVHIYIYTHTHMRLNANSEPASALSVLRQQAYPHRRLGFGPLKAMLPKRNGYWHTYYIYIHTLYIFMSGYSIYTGLPCVHCTLYIVYTYVLCYICIYCNLYIESYARQQYGLTVILRTLKVTPFHTLRSICLREISNVSQVYTMYT